MPPNHHSPIKSLALLSFLSLLPHSAPADPFYHLTSIAPGVPGGPIFSPSLNSPGQVTFSTLVGSSNAYLWTPSSPNATTGLLTHLPKIPDSYVGWTTSSINDLGEIVGQGVPGFYAWTPDLPNASTGTLTLLPSAPPSTRSQPPSINNAGQIAGQTSLNVSSVHTMLWNPSTPPGSSYVAYDLGSTSSADDTAGSSINSAGQIAGYSYVLTPANTYAQRPALWTPDTSNGATGSFRTLPPVDSFADYAQLNALNDSNQAVGLASIYINNQFYSHAFLWNLDPSTPNPVVDLGGPLNSDAVALNSAGAVVGNAQYPNGQHAFLWTPATGMLDLNSLLDSSASGWTLFSATGINSAGQICGVGYDPSGNVEPFLLTLDLPEPSSFAACGLAFLLRRRAKKHKLFKTFV